MLFLIIITLFIFAYVNFRYKELTGPVLLLIFISLGFVTLFSFEFALGRVEFFNSDEITYTINRDLFQGTGTEKTRLLWFYLHDFIYWVDGEYGVANKLISLPFLVILLVIIYKSFDSRLIAIYPLFLSPYIIYMSTTALRDVVIITLSFYVIYNVAFNRYKSAFGVLFLAISLLGLSLLRPFAVVLIFLSLFTAYVVLKRSLSLFKRAAYFVIISGSAAFTAFIMLDTLTMYTYRLETTLLSIDEINLKGEAVTYSPFNIFWFLTKYLITPLPTSLMARLLDGGHLVYGITDDFVRMVHQIIYFVASIYIFINLKLFVKNSLYGYKYLSNQANMFYRVLFVFTCQWAMIYTLFTEGGAHSRVKVVVTLFIVISSLLLYKDKCKNRET
jgi:hypothetical protein